MAVAKVIYKSSANATPETWMDVTQDTVESDKLLASYTATKNDGTSITGSYSAPLLQSKTVTPTTSTQSILPDSGFGGMSQVTVNAIPSAYLIPSGTFSITSNASGIDVGSYASVDVNVAGGQVYTAYLDYNPTYDPSDEAYYKAKVTLNNVVYDQYHREAGTSFTFSPGEILHCYTWDDDGVTAGITVDGITVGTSQGKSKVYDYELPDHDLTIRLVAAKCYITERLPNEDTIVMRIISGTYENNTATEVGVYAFYQCGSLTSVNFSACQYIRQNAFASCLSLTNIIFPACLSIASSAFHTCSSLSIASFPECTNIGDYAFYRNSSLAIISFPKCVSIGLFAFYSCSSLTSMFFPKCSTVGSSAFYQCSALNNASFPVCTIIYSSAFANCSSLTNISFPECLTIHQNAFAYCRSLTSAIFSACTVMYGSAFTYCSNLSNIYFPLCRSIGSFAFNYCSALTSVFFPSCSSINQNVFAFCASLTTAIFPICTRVDNYAFRNCYNLLSLYLLASSICSLINISAFLSTPISTYTTSTGGVNGSIFVPASLYDTYRASTNWVTYSDRFVSMTDAEIDAQFPYSVSVSGNNDTEAQGKIIVNSSGIPISGKTYHLYFQYKHLLSGGVHYRTYSYDGNFVWNEANPIAVQATDVAHTVNLYLRINAFTFNFDEYYGTDLYEIEISAAT